MWQNGWALGEFVADSTIANHASLAQSVERFHGKEEVNSSILLGGSTRTLI